MNKKINIALGIIFLFMVGVRIYVIDSVSTAGEELASLNIELKNLEQDNENLNVELLSLSSLNVIEAKAAELGYANNTFEFLEPQNLALR